MQTYGAAGAEELMSFGSFLPLIVICGLLLVLFLVFKLVKVSSKVLWKLLVNGLLGAAALLLFDAVFVKLLGLDFLYIPITWVTSLVAGVLGVPGVILLLILQFII